VWIYTKLPAGNVELSATVTDVVKASPGHLWRKFGGQTGVSKAAFERYFASVRIGYAIVLEDIRELRPAVHLNAIRKVSAKFHPPQFAKFLAAESRELRLLRRSRQFTSHNKNK
jgi:predicted transcriptional regulator